VFSFNIFIIARCSSWRLSKFSKAMTVCKKIKRESCVSKEMEVCSYVLLWLPNRLCDRCQCKETAVAAVEVLGLSSLVGFLYEGKRPASHPIHSRTITLKYFAIE
jgi:hypothetical protein